MASTQLLVGFRNTCVIRARIVGPETMRSTSRPSRVNSVSLSVSVLISREPDLVSPTLATVGDEPSAGHTGSRLRKNAATPARIAAVFLRIASEKGAKGLGGLRTIKL